MNVGTSISQSLAALIALFAFQRTPTTMTSAFVLMPSPTRGWLSLHDQPHRPRVLAVLKDAWSPTTVLPGSGLTVAHPINAQPNVDDALPPTNKSLRRQLGLPLRALHRTRVVGHRGAMYDALENTVPAFLQCAQLEGCDAVELDVFVLKDGHTVVFHGGGTDENPGDLTDYCLGQDGVNIRDLTLEQAQALVFDPSCFPCSPNAVAVGVIPTLDAVLTALKPYPHMEIKLELKCSGTVRPTLAVVEQHQMQRQCSYSSFNLEWLRELRGLRPDRALYRIGALFNEPVDYVVQARKCGATEIHLPYDACTVECIHALHTAGFGTMAWFRGPVGMASDAMYKYAEDMQHGEDADCYQTVLETGVQQLCVNKPNVLVQLLQRQQKLRELTILNERSYNCVSAP